MSVGRDDAVDSVEMKGRKNRETVTISLSHVHGFSSSSNGNA